MPLRPVSAAVCLVTILSVCTGCGGQSSPISPAPTPAPTVSACGAIGGSPAVLAILHGTTCSQSDSSVVLVNLRDKDGFPSGACSGTVIAPRAVLTAAHCLVGDTAAVRIWPGTGAEVLAQSFQANPRYRENDASSDVGVVITAQDLTRAPMRLLVSRDGRVGEQAVIAGWGNDENGNGKFLRAGMTTITAVSAAVLQTQYNTTNSSVCSGDSGGPLLLSEGGIWAIAGVTSATSVGGSCALGTNYFANARNPDTLAFIVSLVPNASRQ